MDGDEEIWILYKPNIGRDGHFKMSIMLERTTQSVAFQQVVETVNQSAFTLLDIVVLIAVSLCSAITVFCVGWLCFKFRPTDIDPREMTPKKTHSLDIADFESQSAEKKLAETRTRYILHRQQKSQEALIK